MMKNIMNSQEFDIKRYQIKNFKISEKFPENLLFNNRTTFDQIPLVTSKRIRSYKSVKSILKTNHSLSQFTQMLCRSCDQVIVIEQMVQTIKKLFCIVTFPTPFFI